MTAKSEKQTPQQEQLILEISELREQMKTLLLATVDADGSPNVSYAPFVLQADGYYILISELARHTRNLLANSRVSLMMVEDEQGSRNLFARRRLTFDARAEQVARDSDAWSAGIQALSERHGELVTGLAGFGDFHLFRLVALQGRFVKGFGQAFAVSGDDLMRSVHLTGGHRPLTAS